MSKLVDKLIYKILAIIVVVMFVAAFRELIITDKDVSAAFGAWMGVLPFSKQISDMICKIMKYKDSIPLITTSSFITDLIRLAFMAFIQPMVVSILSTIFLRIPSSIKDYAEREDYMSGLEYKVKELILTIVTAPALAILSAHFSTWLFTYFTNTFGNTVSVILGIVSTTFLGGVSLIPLLVKNVSFLTALLWRIVITFGYGMGTTYITNAMCLWVYIAIRNGVEGQITTSVISLVIWLIIMDFGLKCMQHAVVGATEK